MLSNWALIWLANIKKMLNKRETTVNSSNLHGNRRSSSYASWHGPHGLAVRDFYYRIHVYRTILAFLVHSWCILAFSHSWWRLWEAGGYVLRWRAKVTKLRWRNWGDVLRWRIEVTYWGDVLRWRVEVTCWGDVLRWRVEVTCWGDVLRWRVEVTCWGDVLRWRIVCIILFFFFFDNLICVHRTRLHGACERHWSCFWSFPTSSS